MVVLTSRPTVLALFAEIGRLRDASVAIVVLPLDARAVDAAFDDLGVADIAVVDASIERAETIAVCTAIRVLRPRLPISAVFCCPHAATAADLRGLLAAGVEGLLDLQLSAADTLRVLRGVARGQGAFHLQLAAGSSSSLVKLFADERTEDLNDHDVGLLRLVAAGLTDHEIGRQLYLSHHTVKHRIDRLRRRVRARNRIQLAAWAAGQEALRVDRGAAHSASFPPIDEIPAER
ncbi:MAG TPA: LuxR C-terminal-related transcriptional regulator [Solirubrobacter sp.]|nr:LuxR C-terminal-related transcriptional regulator [Solirubrobacter sp.]